MDLLWLPGEEGTIASSLASAKGGMLRVNMEAVKRTRRGAAGKLVRKQ